MIAWLGALLVAKLLRVTIIKGPAMPFIMELPPYRLPTFKGLLIHTWERTWQYIKKAGTVILGISILLWALMTSGAKRRRPVTRRKNRLRRVRIMLDSLWKCESPFAWGRRGKIGTVRLRESGSPGLNRRRRAPWPGPFALRHPG